MEAVEMFVLLIVGGSTLTLTLAAMLRLARWMALRTPQPAATAPRDGGREDVPARE